MSKIQKLLNKFFNNPANLRYSQIEKNLLLLNFNKVQAKGSHVKFKHPRLHYEIIFPIHNNDCLDFYKERAARQVKNNLNIIYEKNY